MAIILVYQESIWVSPTQNTVLFWFLKTGYDVYVQDEFKNMK